MNRKIIPGGSQNIWTTVALCASLMTLVTLRAADTTYSQAVKADNPMLYYRFEEIPESTDAEDSSAGSNTGTFNDVTLGVPSFNAELGQAAEFDGDLSSVSVPALQPAASFTFEAWIKPNVYSTWNCIYDSDGYPDGATHFQLIDDNKVEFSMNGNAPEDIDFGDNSVFAEGVWTYVAVAFTTNSSTAIVYVNGAPLTTNVYSEVVAASFQSAHIGAWNGDDRQFDGLIDEFAIYPTVLSAAQIQAHYRAAVGSFVSVVGHPRDAAVFAGGAATFTASATVVGSSSAPSYQWQRNGVDIPGATNATYTTPALTLADDGSRYRAVITALEAAAAATTREASVSVTALPPTGYANAVMADKPVVYYRFEENSGATAAADSSTGNHPGTYSNVQLQNASFNAVLGNAALFDGSSGRVAVPDLGSMDTFTIEAWIKPTIYKTSQAVYTADVIDSGAPTVELVDDGGVLLSLEGNAPTDMDFGDGSLFPASEWKYLVLTYDSTQSTLKAYVDAELVFEDNYDSALPANFTAGHLGAGSDVNSFYSGLIDEFAVYTNILSDNRILAHWATATGPIISPQPEDAAIFSGNTATFSSGLITGFDDVLRYRWQRDGVDLPGATNASYTTPVLTDADSSAAYHAIITTGGSSFTTRDASVSVTSLPPFGYRDAVLADTPIVYYRFEEEPGADEAVDASSSNNNGTYNGVELAKASYNAVLGHAGRFDEASVSLPPIGDPTQFTIETWIKPDVYEEFNAVFATADWMQGSVHFLLIDDEKISLSLNAGPDVNGDDQEEDAIFGGSDLLAVGEWRYVAATYDSANSQSKFYVNGVLAGTHTFAIPPVTAGLENANIGAWNGDDRFFFGLIDEFAMYDKVLSPERILAHYQAAAGTTVERPNIGVARSGNQLTLTWTSSGFILEQNNDLSTGNWQPVAGVSGNSATVSAASGTSFFRLHKP